MRIFGAAPSNPLFNDVMRSIKPSQAADRILVACMPKSGSTFVSRCLVEFCRVPRRILHASSEIQELSKTRLEMIGDKGCVAQSHIFPTKNNLALIKEHDLAIVVLQRNVMDCLVSLRDMYVERVQSQEGVWADAFISQFGYFDHAFLSLDPPEQYDYIIETALVWYLQFHIAWNSQHLSGYKNLVRINYERFFADTQANFEKLLDDLGCLNAERLASFTLPAKAPGSDGVRFNVGRPGRGRELLSPAQRERIHRIAARLERATGADLSPMLDVD